MRASGDRIPPAPICRWHDQAAVFGQRDEVARLIKPLGVLPAHERLETRDPTISEQEDRLIVNPELVAFDGAVQLALEMQVLVPAMIHAGFEHGIAPTAPGGFGAIQGDVRFAQQIAAVRCPGRPAMPMLAAA